MIEEVLLVVKLGRRRMLLVRLADGSGGILLRFFYFTAQQQAGFKAGMRLRCFGEVRSGPAMLEMVHPEYRVINGTEPAAVEECLTPVYPATEGMQQYTLRALTQQALDRLANGLVLQELLPEEILDRLRLPPLVEALTYVHRPPPDAPLAVLEEGRHPAQQRLAFEELLAHHLSLRLLRSKMERLRAPRLDAPGRLGQALLDNLTFDLTGAQRRVVDEVIKDMRRPHPMHRLVQGDVGSGKTVVAALAVLHAVEAGFQAAVMAPTELLAEQHLQNFRRWLEPLGIGGVAVGQAAGPGARRVAGASGGRRGRCGGGHACAVSGG